MINIRLATREDAGRILDFQLRMARETEDISLDKLVVAQGINALFDDPAKGVYYVAEVAGTVAGCFLITFEWSDWRNGMIWWLQSLYVDINYRQQGIFKRMYDYIIQTIEGDSSISGLRLYVDKSNERAQHVYRSTGMNGDHYTVFEWMK
ncbi:MAG TPA: GNAT family N-acetyltransferase [Chryseosolibacter sp.]|jgi:Acetyltransferases